MNTVAPTKKENFSTPLPGTCYHCGENCGREIVQFAEKNFCCQGCKMVFEILNENDLCRYYELDEQAGISLKGKKQAQYAWLDDALIQSQLIDYQDDKLTKITLYLPAIHCASCVWLLENLYKFNEGILDSKINFLKKEVKLTYDVQQISLRQIAELLSSIGYAPEINMGDLDDSQRAKVDKKLIYQLGVTGFIFGNIMLLSFPEYLGLNEINAIGFQKWLGWLNVLLSLPVVFFGGKDYLKSAWLSLSQRSLNIDVPISIGILTLFGRSIFEIVTATGAGYLDSLAGLIFFLLIGKWFQQITYNHLSFERDYKSYFPVAAMLQNGTSVPIQNLKVGDTIVIKNKELIPADGILLKGKASIDYSFVTGESAPVAKTDGEQLYAGGKQIGEALYLQINKTVSQSYLTQLWNDAAFSKDKIDRSQMIADRVGKYFTYFILTVAFLTLAYWINVDTSKAINAFTAVLIIACPCAVALSIPFTFGNAIRILGRHHFYLKNTQVIEQLQQVTAVVFDKTGTLTSSEDELVSNKNNSPTENNLPTGQAGNTLTFVGETLTTDEQAAVMSLVSQSSHPLSKQIFAFFKSNFPENFELNLEIKNWKETEGQGLTATINQQFLKLGSANFTHNEGKEKGNVFLQINRIDKGFFILKNKYRAGFENVIDYFSQPKNGKTAACSVHLLSGDNAQSRSELAPYFGKNLHYSQSPKEKLDFIKNLQAQGEKVLMLGDGLNDAGALQQSDVGIVIAENTNNFTPACDAILDAQKFAALPDFLKYTKGCIRLLYVAYGLALLYNFVGLSFAVQAKLSPVIAAILMPASSITIVLFGVVSSTLLAWKLGKK